MLWVHSHGVHVVMELLTKLLLILVLIFSNRIQKHQQKTGNAVVMKCRAPSINNGKTNQSYEKEEISESAAECKRLSKSCVVSIIF